MIQSKKIKNTPESEPNQLTKKNLKNKEREKIQIIQKRIAKDVSISYHLIATTNDTENTVDDNITPNDIGDRIEKLEKILSEGNYEYLTWVNRKNLTDSLITKHYTSGLPFPAPSKDVKITIRGVKWSSSTGKAGARIWKKVTPKPKPKPKATKKIKRVPPSDDITHKKGDTRNGYEANCKWTIKRSKRPYDFFNKETHKTIRKENPKMTFGEIRKEVSERWKATEDKAKYITMAKNDKIHNEQIEAAAENSNTNADAPVKEEEEEKNDGVEYEEDEEEDEYEEDEDDEEDNAKRVKKKKIEEPTVASDSSSSSDSDSSSSSDSDSSDSDEKNDDDDEVDADDNSKVDDDNDSNDADDNDSNDDGDSEDDFKI
jgi:hypothetical protein